MTTFVSIGPYCQTALILIEHNLRPYAFPFDYLFTSLEVIQDCIDDRFNKFLDKQYYRQGTDPTSTKHTLYCTYLDTDILIKQQMYDGKSGYYKPSTGNFFNHHNLLDNTSEYEMFQRRTERLMSLIESDQKLVFVYYNRFTSDYSDIVDFSNYCLKYNNIYILGIFENKDEKKVLYESSNCTLYQNYDKHSIFQRHGQ